jgi:hypothetical protein
LEPLLDEFTEGLFVAALAVLLDAALVTGADCVVDAVTVLSDGSCTSTVPVSTISAVIAPGVPIGSLLANRYENEVMPNAQVRRGR